MIKMRKFRILICSTGLPPFAGGAEQVAWETAKRLAKFKDVEIHILTTGKESTVIKDGVIIHQIPNVFGKEIYYTTIGRSKLKKFYDLNFDLLHFHLSLPWAYVFRKYNAKKILTAHGGEVYCTLKPIRRFLNRLVLKKMDVVTTPGKEFSKKFVEIYGVQPIIIPNGVDIHHFKPRKGQKSDVVLFIGRLIARKGVLDLIKAAQSLPKYKFVFVGEGPLKEKLKGKNIVRKGALFGEALLKEYRDATICVFPSHWENMPMVGLEAMACGKATIVTPRGFSEFIQNNKEGILVEPHSPEKLKLAISMLMSNKKLREEIERNARRKALSYDWNKIALTYYKLYKCTLTENGKLII
ncbi:MAG: glycosyltransferase family 4 protein [Candidatus Woesearchaeota archaeon]